MKRLTAGFIHQNTREYERSFRMTAVLTGKVSKPLTRAETLRATVVRCTFRDFEDVG
jgi:hypothetical protein